MRAALTRRFGAVGRGGRPPGPLAALDARRPALVGGSVGELERTADRLERYLDGRFPEGVRVERQLVSFEDLD